VGQRILAPSGDILHTICMYVDISIYPIPDDEDAAPPDRAAPPDGPVSLESPTSPGELDRLSRFFKALSEPTRLRVVLALTDECRPVSELAAATGLPQPSVSHHLRILRDADIARPDRRGNQVYY